MNILTEREFLTTSSLNPNILRTWISEGLLTPIKVFGDKFVYLKRHLQLTENIQQLQQHGLSIAQIKPFIEGEVVNVEQVLQNSNIDERTPEFFQMLEYDELVARCREARIVGFRRMTREEMEICLSDPEQRDEIIERVRQRNRRRTTPAPTPVAPVETPPETVVINLETAQPELVEHVMNMNYTDLVSWAQQERITGFRRMTKEELQQCYIGTPEERQRIIEEVRIRTRERYGSGSGRTRTVQRLQEVPVVEDVTIPLPVVEQTLEVEEPTVEEDVTETTVLDDVDEFLDEVEPVVDEEEEFDEEVTLTSAEVPYTYEELQAMNSKQVAVVVRDHLDIKYFRRMTKEELIICIFYPERREEMIQNAAERYERYRGRVYGQRTQ